MKPIGKILRDNIWEFVGVVVSVVGIVVAVIVAYNIFFLQRQVKELQVVILANTSLVEVEQSVAEDIKVLYRDQPIANLSVIQVKIENSGTRVIREEDYARPIKFVFPVQAEIVEATVLESSPPNIGMAVEAEQNVAILSPVLMNAEDRVIIRFLVINVPAGGDTQPFEIDARIAEVKDVHVMGVIEERRRMGFFVSFLVGGFLGFVTITFVNGLIYQFRLVYSAVKMVFPTRTGDDKT